MSYLVDTNVYSEPVKPKPDPKVVAWLRQHEGELHVSTITIGEIRRGIERLPDGSRKTLLRAWLQAICDCIKAVTLSSRSPLVKIAPATSADRNGSR